ncbi:MAG TPA: hypothetical protein VG937_26495 [Polyangiaceae bacterium]|nr:hypothetical protein [Polyangiaceae bacterium]
MQQLHSELWNRQIRPASLAALALLTHCSASPSAADAATKAAAFPNQRSDFTRSEGRALAYVANRFSDTVSVLDLNDLRTLDEVPIGRDPVDIDGPRHVVLDPARGSAYVLLGYPFSASSPHAVASGATRRSGYVRELSLADLRPLGDLRVEPRAGDLTLSRDKSRLAVAHFDQDLALAQDVEARRADVAWATSPWPSDIDDMKTVPACASPSELVFGADASLLFVACTGEDSLVVLDVATGSVQSRVAAGPDPVNKPFSLSSDASGTRLLLSNQVTRKVVAFTTDHTPSPLFATEAFEGIPFGATYVSEREFIVPLQDPSGAARVDASNGKVLSQVAYTDDECLNPGRVSVLGDGREFMVCEGSHYEPGWVSEIDPSTLRVLGSAPLGLYPDRLAVSELEH